MSEVAAVLTQAAITHLMSAHIKLKVLLELADLGVFQGGGTHNVDQTPAARPEKYEAPDDQIFTPSSLHVTFRHLTGQAKDTENELWERQTSTGKTKPLPSYSVSTLGKYFQPPQPTGDALLKFRNQTRFKICSKDTNSSGSASP